MAWLFFSFFFSLSRAQGQGSEGAPRAADDGSHHRLIFPSYGSCTSASTPQVSASPTILRLCYCSLLVWVLRHFEPATVLDLGSAEASLSCSCSVYLCPRALLRQCRFAELQLLRTDYLILHCFGHTPIPPPPPWFFSFAVPDRQRWRAIGVLLSFSSIYIQNYTLVGKSAEREVRARRLSAITRSG